MPDLQNCKTSIQINASFVDGAIPPLLPVRIIYNSHFQSHCAVNTCVCPMSHKQHSYINKHRDTSRIRLMRRKLPFLEKLSSILLHHRRGKRLFLLLRSIASICLQPPKCLPVLSWHRKRIFSFMHFRPKSPSAGIFFFSFFFFFFFSHDWSIVWVSQNTRLKYVYY